MIDIKYNKKFKEFVPLSKLKQERGLEEMFILKKGNRLSITPLTRKEFEIIQKMGA
jgi:predicted RNA-binding protein with PUA-like domain